VQLKSALPQMSLPDTFAYFSSLEVERGLKTTLAAGPRVVRKSSRNNDSGASSTAHEGAWLVALASGNYCEKLGDATLVDSDLVILQNIDSRHHSSHVCTSAHSSPMAQHGSYYWRYCAQ
jgi:hypothetical protein